MGPEWKGLFLLFILGFVFTWVLNNKCRLAN